MPVRTLSINDGNAAAVSPAAAARVLFLVVNEGLSSIFPAMVARPVGMLHDAGIGIDLAVLCPVGDFVRPLSRRRWQSADRELRKYFDGEFVRLPSAPSRFRRFWSDTGALTRWIDRRYCDNERLIVHCRGPQAAALAIEARKTRPSLRVLFDMRGLQFAERLQKAGVQSFTDAPVELKGAPASTRELERSAAVESDAIICVNHVMASQIVSEFGLRPDKITVVWNHLDVSEFREAHQHRDATRSALGVADRYVVSYCGSFEPWQPADVCLDVFLKVRECVSQAHLLVLTKHIPTLLDSIQRKGLSDREVTVRTVPHFEVPRYLAAADVGIIPRGLHGTVHLADRVSSPVKFAEYLAAGTPVIMAEGIGDYSELAAREHVGLILPDEGGATWRSRLREFIEGYRAAPEDWRSRCVRVASLHLDSGVHLPKIAALYRELSQ